MVMPLFDAFSLQLSTTPISPLRVFSPARDLFSTFYPHPRRVVQPCSMTTTMPANSTHHAPATLPEMPLELVLSFIESACVGIDTDAHIPLLMACSLVCKSWSTAAQRLLFEQVTLRSQSSFELFMNAVDRTTPHGQLLGDAVKRVRVVLDHKQPSSLHHHSFALAVTVCPNLYELDISLYGCPEPGRDIVGVQDVSRLRRSAPSFDEQTLSLLKSGPKIKSLHFSNWSENQESIFQLLEVWPSLQFISIGGTTPLQPPDAVRPFSCALQGLLLNFQDMPSVEFLRWLLHNSTDSLKHLHFERDPCLDTLEYLLDTFGPQLESVRIPGFMTSKFAASIPKCTGLRFLHTENPSLPNSFFKHLPSSLEHISFGLDHATLLSYAIDFIKEHEALQTAKVLLREGGHKHPLLSPLRIAFAYQGVDSTITNDLQVFRA